MRQYFKIGNYIFLPLLFMALVSSAWAQSDQPVDSMSVTGTIKAAATDTALSGVNVSVAGYSAAITDEDGNFNIKVPSYHAVLRITGQGFQEKLIALKGRSHLVIALYKEPYQSVYDQVTLPLRRISKAHTVYSINTLDLNDKWARSTKETTGSILQGEIPGLNVIRHSGTPSSGAALFLRGFNSLYTNSQPLIVVDGMIYDNDEYGASLIAGHHYNPLTDIDIKDIENITVIKSGTSTYGTRGANGVILITTARAGELATKIDFAAYGGYNNAVNELPVMNAHDYRIYLSDLYQSGNFPLDTITSFPFMNDGKNPSYYRYHYNTNWQKQILKNSYNQNYYLKVTGGDNIAAYALSVGYLKNEGILKNTDLTRYQSRFNGDLNLSKRLKASINVSLTSNQQRLQNEGMASQTNPLYLSQIKAPFLRVHVVDDSGIVSPNLSDVDIFRNSNPLAVANNMQGENKNYRFTGAVKFQYELNESLSLQTLLGITFDKVQEDIFIPQEGVVADTLKKAVAYNTSGSNVERYYGLYNDTRLTYSHIFDNIHRLSANLGFRYNYNKSESEYGMGHNSATDEFVSVGMGDPSLRSIDGAIGRWNWLNTYLNANYSLRNKYFLSFNLAIDGSSRFGKEASDALSFSGNKYAVMPSVAVGWLLSSENFFSGLNNIDLLKLRASYGRVGNYDIGNYAARQYYVSQNLLGMEGLVRGNIGNPALKWESVNKTDIGLDASLLNERLSITLDGYFNKTSGMITLTPTTTATGFKYVTTNNSAMETRGFEAMIRGRIINHIFKWDMGLNIATYKNKITAIPDGERYTEFAGATYLTKTGQAANLFYGYKMEGVFSSEKEAALAGLKYGLEDGSFAPFQAGDVHFKDMNGDHIINEEDRTVIGNPNPDFTGGWTNTFSWKQWTLDALFTFSYGNDIYNYSRAYLESLSDENNQTRATVNRWRYDGQVTNIPRASWGDPSGNARFSDRWIEDGSYLRLRMLSLSYSFPVDNSILRYVKVYATGNNLFTWTKYLGYDPEFSASDNVFTQGVDLSLEPQFRTIQLGIRLGF